MRTILLLGLISITFTRWEGNLTYNPDGQFKILQLTDFHYGSDSYEGNRITTGLQYKLIETIKPDLVVLSGDMFTGFNSQCHYPFEIEKNGCFERGWLEFTYPLTFLNQKYAIINGNHDTDADLNSQKIVELDSTNNFSLTNSPTILQSPDGSNYYLKIYDQNQTKLETLIWMFDSHDINCDGQPSTNGCVEIEQIEWFKKENIQLLNQSNQTKLSSIAFVHIPPPEFVDMYNQNGTDGNMFEDINCPCQNTGLVQALMDQNVSASFSGHDHNNDFYGTFRKGNQQINLGYGRKSGYGLYGPPEGINRGGRVIMLSKQNDSFSVETILYDEVGNYINQTGMGKTPQSLNRASPCYCGLFPVTYLYEKMIFSAVLLLIIILALIRYSRLCIKGTMLQQDLLNRELEISQDIQQ